MTAPGDKVTRGKGRSIAQRDRLVLAGVVLAVILAQFVGVQFLIARQVYQRTGVITYIDQNSKHFSLAVDRNGTTLMIEYNRRILLAAFYVGAYVKVAYRGAWGKRQALKIEVLTGANTSDPFERFGSLHLNS